jgi:hypothetical protein
VIGRHLGDPWLQTVSLRALLPCSGSSSYRLMATFLPGRKRGCFGGFLYIGASLLGALSIVCIGKGSVLPFLLPGCMHIGLRTLL